MLRAPLREMLLPPGDLLINRAIGAARFRGILRQIGPIDAGQA